MFIGDTGNKSIKLLDCRYAYGRGTVIGGSAVEVTEYVAMRALIGEYAPSGDDPRFDRVVFSLTQLNNWAGRHLLGRETLSVRPRQWTETPVPDLEARLPKATIRLANFVEESWDGRSTLHLRDRAQIEIDLEEKLPISEILGSYISPFAALVTLASGAASNITDIWVADADVTTDKGSPMFLSLRLYRGSSAREESEELPTPLMRFSLRTPEVSFQNLLSEWFNLYETIGDDCQLLLSLDGNDTIYPWNDLFKVASVAEGMHRKLNPELERESSAHKRRVKAIKDAVASEDRDLVRQALIGSHRPTFRSRLIALCDEVGPAASILTGEDREKWASLVISHRDDVAHSLGKTIDIGNVDAVTSLMLNVRILLQLFLLRKLGFSGEYCKMQLIDQPSWAFFVSQMHEYLPELYAPAEGATATE